jgi:hypothetical protein
MWFLTAIVVETVSKKLLYYFETLVLLVKISSTSAIEYISPENLYFEEFPEIVLLLYIRINLRPRVSTECKIGYKILRKLTRMEFSLSKCS